MAAIFYTALANRAHGVNNGFYPLGSCTMKYNPRINDEMANQAGFAAVHPLQPKETVQGCTEALELLDKYLCEITGMDKMDFINTCAKLPAWIKWTFSRQQAHTANLPGFC